LTLGETNLDKKVGDGARESRLNWGETGFLFYFSK
jgi:hypothetical protein